MKMKRQHSSVAFSLALVALSATWGNAQTEPDRTVLPLKEPTYPPITELDARKATAPPLFQVKAPKQAPNVIVILL